MGLNYLGAPGAPGVRGDVKVYPGPATATSSEGASWASVAGGSHKKVATTTNKTADLVRDCFIVVFSLVKGFII
jgi:hypothetical protein